MPNITHDTPADTGPDAPARGNHANKRISESEIKREIERQAGPAR